MLDSSQSSGISLTLMPSTSNDSSGFVRVGEMGAIVSLGTNTTTTTTNTTA